MDVGSAAEQQEPGLLLVMEDRGDVQARSDYCLPAAVYVCSVSVSCLLMVVQLCALLVLFLCPLSHGGCAL